MFYLENIPVGVLVLILSKFDDFIDMNNLITCMKNFRESITYDCILKLKYPYLYSKLAYMGFDISESDIPFRIIERQYDLDMSIYMKTGVYQSGLLPVDYILNDLRGGFSWEIITQIYVYLCMLSDLEITSIKSNNIQELLILIGKHIDYHEVSSDELSHAMKYLPRSYGEVILQTFNDVLKRMGGYRHI
jgi:hypothetical protein